jgi:hypothetical protein
MAGTSKEELQSIYFELADFKARAGQLPEAADCYALALYYARRVGNQPLADLCREQILACHPNHVAVRENNAPLFFAQLLMRYPAEECSVELQRLKKERATQPTATPAANPAKRFDYAHPAPTMMASHEAPPTIPANPAHPSHFGLPSEIPLAPRMPTSPMDMGPSRLPQNPSTGGGGVGMLDYPGIASDAPRGGLASLFGPSAPKQAWSESVSLPLAEPGRSATHPYSQGIGQSGFENHHPFPQVGSSTVMGNAQRVIDDFEAAPHPGRVESHSPMPTVSNPWAWLEPLAGAVALAGIVMMGFFAYKVWPEVQKVDTRRISRMVDESFQQASLWCRVQYDRFSPTFAPSPAVDPNPTSADGTPVEPTVTAEPLPSVTPPTASTELPALSNESLAPPADLPAPRALPPIPTATTELPNNQSVAPEAPAGWSAPESTSTAPPAPVSHLEPVLPPK